MDNCTFYLCTTKVKQEPGIQSDLCHCCYFSACFVGYLHSSCPCFRLRSSQSHRRPLPLTPPQQRSRAQRSSVHQCRGPGVSDPETRGHGHEEAMRRRETVHWFPMMRRGQESDTEHSEHIYEEIHEEASDEELTKEELSPHSFLSLISLERRRHLRFYGRTDWDYGSDRY